LTEKELVGAQFPQPPSIQGQLSQEFCNSPCLLTLVETQAFLDSSAAFRGKPSEKQWLSHDYLRHARVKMDVPWGKAANH
jgi:hypothetical protein